MKTKMSKIRIFFLLLLSTVFIVKAQNNNDVLLKAMKSELDRSKNEFQKDSLIRPFFISLLVEEENFNYSFSTIFGFENSEKLDSTKNRIAIPRVFVGSYQRSQNLTSGKSDKFDLPVVDNELAIRTTIWENLDNVYKKAVKSFDEKQAWLKQQNNTPEELAIPDFEKRNPTVFFEKTENSIFNVKQLKSLSLKIGKQLSEAVKKEQLQVDILKTNLNISRKLYRYYDTEGSMFMYPAEDGSFSISLTGVNSSGENIRVYKNFAFNGTENYPAYEELSETVNRLVGEYKNKFSASKSDEPYLGPILIVNEKVGDITDQIITSLYTSPKSKLSNGNYLQNMPGLRIISKQLSMKIDYRKRGQKIETVKRDLIPIDAEAVIPPDSIQLIKNGILKNMLTTRMPVKNFSKSNGNFRINNWDKPNGVITLYGNEQFSYDELKEMLMEEAALQGLKYAYIIDNDENIHKKVDVKTGEEIPFTAAFTLGQIMKTMRRVMGVENKMSSSVDGTIRYPKSILLEDVELTTYKSSERLNEEFVPRPK